MNTEFPKTSPAIVPERRRLIRAAAIADAMGTLAAPGVILLEGSNVIASGSPQSIGAVGDASVEECTREIVIAALVNAHAHLDLTHIGPIPFHGDFTGWVDRVRAERARSPHEIAASVTQGVRLARAGGTAIIGDIAGVRSTVPTLTQREERLAGISFLEVFGVGRTQAAAVESLHEAVASISPLAAGVRLGIQPHAPYSCGPDVYRAAEALRMPMSTHLAETQDELEFVSEGAGPLADMLRHIGVWDDSITGFNTHSIDHVSHLLRGWPFVAAHVNYAEDRHIRELPRIPITVAYCPRASAYFGHTNHRYREMLASGVNVALGTDSMLCLDTPDRISVLDDMRLLHQRDGVDPLTLMTMATINGARALWMRESLVALRPGESAGLIALSIDRTPSSAVDGLSQALRRHDVPRWMLGPIDGNDAWFQ